MRRDPPLEKREKTADDIFADELRTMCANAIIRSLKESGINLQRPIASLKMHEIEWLAEAATSAWIAGVSERVFGEMMDSAVKAKYKNILLGA